MKEIRVQVNNEQGKKPLKNSRGLVLNVNEGCEIKLIIGRSDFSRMKILGTSSEGILIFKDECGEVDLLVRDSGIHDRLAPFEDHLRDTQRRIMKCEMLGDEMQASQLQFLAKTLENKIKEIKDEEEL